MDIDPRMKLPPNGSPLGGTPVIDLGTITPGGSQGGGQGTPQGDPQVTNLSRTALISLVVTHSPERVLLFVEPDGEIILPMVTFQGGNPFHLPYLDIPGGEYETSQEEIWGSVPFTLGMTPQAKKHELVAFQAWIDGFKGKGFSFGMGIAPPEGDEPPRVDFCVLQVVVASHRLAAPAFPDRSGEFIWLELCHLYGLMAKKTGSIWGPEGIMGKTLRAKGVVEHLILALNGKV